MKNETDIKRLTLYVMHPLGLLQGKKLYKGEKNKSSCSRITRTLPYVGSIIEVSNISLCGKWQAVFVLNLSPQRNGSVA